MGVCVGGEGTLTERYYCASNSYLETRNMGNIMGLALHCSHCRQKEGLSAGMRVAK